MIRVTSLTTKALRAHEALRAPSAVAATAAFIAAVAALTLSAASASKSMQSFDGNAGWLNSDPLTPAQLRGKVVLVDFWEYTCINCLRTLPYLREWYKRYRDKGFVIVGVHTPEFGFSGERANVAAAAKRLDVTWPVVLDPTFDDLETLRQLDLAARISLQPKRRARRERVG